MLRQIFNLEKSIQEYKDLMQESEENMYTLAEGKKLQKRFEKIQKKIQTNRLKVAGSSIQTLQFVYNFTASTTRMGLRGQDIQDKLNIQDKLVNKGLGLVNTAVVSGGNPAAIAFSIISTATSELVSVIQQTIQYNYKNQLDNDRQQIYKERVGETAWNYSRRG